MRNEKQTIISVLVNFANNPNFVPNTINIIILVLYILLLSCLAEVYEICVITERYCGGVFAVRLIFSLKIILDIPQKVFFFRLRFKYAQSLLLLSTPSYNVFLFLRTDRTNKTHNTKRHAHCPPPLPPEQASSRSRRNHVMGQHTTLIVWTWYTSVYYPTSHSFSNRVIALLYFDITLYIQYNIILYYCIHTHTHTCIQQL